MLEWYGRGNDAHSLHILMSSTKAVIGLLAGILHEEGTFNVNELVSNCVPEIASTGYRGATIRDLLGRRAGVIPDAQALRAYEAATNWAPVEWRPTPGGLEES